MSLETGSPVDPEALKGRQKGDVQCIGIMAIDDRIEINLVKPEDDMHVQEDERCGMALSPLPGLLRLLGTGSRG